ncbi:hypothetical protein M407DRAFT_21501 [Tulasnella calospora MUT 4182]|uniref:Uncharacterized protein n=1 Tax=Tulasnella calospora MUT 4182 TaxID=1051891 RepID=A0A0C3QPU7_9AGAM|nr:hypothetical protein M407DRAFT_21501 [Tulasnella calospora MUT 4182]
MSLLCHLARYQLVISTIYRLLEPPDGPVIQSILWILILSSPIHVASAPTGPVRVHPVKGMFTLSLTQYDAPGTSYTLGWLLRVGNGVRFVRWTWVIVRAVLAQTV